MSKPRYGTVYIVSHWLAYDSSENLFASLDKEKAEKFRNEHQALLQKYPPGEEMEGYHMEEMELQ